MLLTPDGPVAAEMFLQGSEGVKEVSGLKGFLDTGELLTGIQNCFPSVQAGLPSSGGRLHRILTTDEAVAVAL